MLAEVLLHQRFVLCQLRVGHVGARVGVMRHESARARANSPSSQVIQVHVVAAQLDFSAGSRASAPIIALGSAPHVR
jgi:hypothetical protein